MVLSQPGTQLIEPPHPRLRVKTESPKHLVVHMTSSLIASARFPNDFLIPRQDGVNPNLGVCYTDPGSRVGIFDVWVHLFQVPYQAGSGGYATDGVSTCTSPTTTANAAGSKPLTWATLDPMNDQGLAAALPNQPVKVRIALCYRPNICGSKLLTPVKSASSFNLVRGSQRIALANAFGLSSAHICGVQKGIEILMARRLGCS